MTDNDHKLTGKQVLWDNDEIMYEFIQQFIDLSTN